MFSGVSPRCVLTDWLVIDNVYLTIRYLSRTPRIRRGIALLDKNVYWNAAGKPVLFPGNLTLDQWREKRKHDLQSVVADPLFVDAKGGNYQLKPESPALPLGFKPFDATKAGRQTPPVLTKDLPRVPPAFQ